MTTPSRGSILIVDDKIDNIKLLREILTEQGYKTRAARNGDAALESVASAAPDLILLDISMPPGISGYEVCKRLKAQDDTRAIPVLFISALDDVIDKVRAFAVGGVDYINKPFQVEEVLARVKTHLTLARLQQAAATAHPAPLEHPLLPLLRQSPDDPVAPDTVVERELTLLAVAHPVLTDYASSPPTVQRLHAVTALLGQINPVIRAQHGLPHYDQDHGVLAVFPRQTADAITAAQALTQIAHPHTASLRLGIHHAPILIGVVGDERWGQLVVAGDGVDTVRQLPQLVAATTFPLLVSAPAYHRLDPTIQADYERVAPLALSDGAEPLPLYRNIRLEQEHHDAV